MVTAVRPAGATTVERSRRSRRRSLSSRSAASKSSESEDDKAAMLAALEAHQRSLFGMEEPENGESSAQGAARHSGSSVGEGLGDSDSEEEWNSDDGSGGEDLEDGVNASAVVPEVVFAAMARRGETISAADKRAFLKGNSSKLMGIQSEAQKLQAGKKRRRTEDDDADDQSNLKLDKTLHDMLLTNLLPSSASASARRPIDKQKAISGRLLELAKYELPGQGSSSLTRSSLSSHSAKIRTGIIKARDKKSEEARKEAEAGSWVRGVGTVGKKQTIETGRQRRVGLGMEVGKKKGMQGRKNGERDRGLDMGIGKFRDGMLSLSKGEIARGSRRDDGPRFKGKKRGRR